MTFDMGSLTFDISDKGAVFEFLVLTNSRSSSRNSNTYSRRHYGPSASRTQNRLGRRGLRYPPERLSLRGCWMRRFPEREVYALSMGSVRAVRPELQAPSLLLRAGTSKRGT